MILKEDRCILEGKEEAVRLLMEKAEELGRIPKKQDFHPRVVGAIKEQLGPWPRALEVVGLKETGQTYLNRQAKRQEKRKKHCRKRKQTE